MAEKLKPSSNVRDRLVTTLFAAAMLHGIVIAGISFSGEHGNGAAPGLDVIIVSDEVPAAPDNNSAQYLAQRSQLGGGSTREKVTPRSQASLPALPARAGQLKGTSASDFASAAPDSNPPVLTSRSHQPKVHWLGDSGESATAGPMPLLLDAQRGNGAGSSDDGPAQLSGPKRDELWITPNTRESALAPWLDTWRRKVEQLGTLNYPAAARHSGLHANPVLEVSINRDGSLVDAHVRTSSGDPEVDQAALDILRLASPFAAFPDNVNAKLRVLRFAYEWQFDSGVATTGVLTVPTPSQ